MIEHLSRAALLLLSTALVSGCVSNSVAVFTRGAESPPPLVGKRVAVLPIVSLGQDASAAAASLRIANEVFDGEFGSATFTRPTDTLFALDDPTIVLGVLREKLAALRGAAVVEMKGKPRTLVPRGALPVASGDNTSPEMTIAEGPPLLGNTFPDFLDVELFAGLDADYVLGSVTTARYREFADILAIYGILPIGKGRQTFAHLPFSVYALYDRRTGQRVWESYIGSTVDSLHARKQSVDPRAAPVLGAAYILTKEANEALARALGVSQPAVAPSSPAPTPTQAE